MVRTRTDTERRSGDEVSVSLPESERGTARYVVTSSAFDFDHFRSRRSADVGPGHAMDALRICLDADIVQPADDSARRFDRLASKITGQPQHWAQARSLVADLRSGDLVYATGDDAGLPIGFLAALRRKRIKLAIFYSAPHRTRPRVLTKALDRLGIDILPIAGADDKVDMLTDFGLRRPGVLSSEQTDTGFFRPAQTAEQGEPRALITSCGLEQRDYATMVEALDGFPVEVKICAVSPNFTTSTVVAMPEVVPRNVEMRRFEFAELRELYQQAAVTVIPLLENHYSAGMTTMMEAIACGSPVVITANPGLARDFADMDLVVGVPPGDTAALRSAVEEMLTDPEPARERAERARRHVLEHHSSDRYVELLCGRLTAFHAS